MDELLLHGHRFDAGVERLLCLAGLVISPGDPVGRIRQVVAQLALVRVIPDEAPEDGDRLLIGGQSVLMSA